MPIEAAEFRRILGHWTTGVAVVTTMTADGEPRGLTANAVASVSLEPLLVLACVERIADTHDAITTAQYFAINILAQDDERTARRFAGDDISDKFTGLAWHVQQTGAPILDTALAWIDCHVHTAYEGGDHTIFIGEVVAGDAREGEPLGYYRGGYARLTT
jgi:flavin reductase (DIM6/NTAB) family NADH-FMN oxidoreductase RutF